MSNGRVNRDKCTMSLICCLGVKIGSGESCTTPRDDVGVCIDIKQCRSLLDYLTNKHGDPGVKEYLLASVCSRQGSLVIACCPIEKSMSLNSDFVKLWLVPVYGVLCILIFQLCDLYLQCVSHI